MTETTGIRPAKGNFGKIILRIFLVLCVLTATFIVTIILLGFFAASKRVSYLPTVNLTDLRSVNDGVSSAELKNAGYIINVSKDGRIEVKNTTNEVIISSLVYYASYEGANEKWGMDNTSAELTSDTTLAIAGTGPLGVQVNILLTAPKGKSRLDINVKSRFSTKTVVRREAFLSVFDVPVSEVYKKNGQIDFNSFDNEYWLLQQGVRFGNGNRSAFIYHTPGISSMQIDTKKNLLYVNLDYYLDHPFIHYPYQEDAGGRWEDLSLTTYNPGSELDNHFTIYINNTSKIPRLKLEPYGYLAGYVFTEHADGGTTRTNRAAYFGSEDIIQAKDATGGFAGHKIPVTKSIFYADPDSAAYTSVINDPQYPQFLDFLEQLNNTGLYDLCLHTPENLNSTRARLEESIKFMYEKFGTSTWIDHAFYSGKINREAFVSDGLNPKSDYYAADLWEKYNTRYFWTPVLEETRTYSLKEKIMKLKFYEVSENLWKRYLSPEELHALGFFASFKAMVNRFSEKGEFNSLMSYKSNAFPTPLFWRNRDQGSNFYSWGTDNVKDFKDLSDKKIRTEQKLIAKLVSDRGIFINHGYFVRNGPGDDELIMKDGKLVVNPYFDQILSLMAKTRDDGDLYITTIRDLLDYWLLTGNVSFDYRQDGTILLCNNNDKPIKGLSLAVNALNVTVNDRTPEVKRVGDDTIFWFDIEPREHVIIKLQQD
jgi:hypothetical protein